MQANLSAYRSGNISELHGFRFHSSSLLHCCHFFAPLLGCRSALTRLLVELSSQPCHCAPCGPADLDTIGPRVALPYWSADSQSSDLLCTIPPALARGHPIGFFPTILLTLTSPTRSCKPSRQWVCSRALASFCALTQQQFHLQPGEV